MFSPPNLRPKVLLPNTRIRVLVVDDSVVIRRLITHALAEDDQIEVVGIASNGIIGLQKILQLKPDVITLDVEMPDMDGFETLQRIRQLYPEMPVIMFSTLTERGAAVTFKALSMGASDYVTKAANIGSLEKSMEALRSDLLPKVKQFFKLGKDHAPPRPVGEPLTAAPRHHATPLRNAFIRKKVLAIGTSTGGPNALAEIMPMFPKNFGLPILIVQHMPPLFTRFLAERLNAISAIGVEEVKEGARLEPGKALVAAGGFHMRVQKLGESVVATMDQEAPENSCRPAVDVMFRSVASVYGGATVAVILTGMGNDGLRGVETLKQMGAYVIAQDEQSSVVWGMPGCVARAGLANATVALNSVVPEILKHV